MHSSPQMRLIYSMAAAALGGAAAMFPERMGALHDLAHGTGRPKRSMYVAHQGEREKARRRRQMAAGKLNCTITEG